eukprot:scaffold148366_cov31-Tisochrysis_lutea.AAC.3
MYQARCMTAGRAPQIWNGAAPNFHSKRQGVLAQATRLPSLEPLSQLIHRHLVTKRKKLFQRIAVWHERLSKRVRNRLQRAEPARSTPPFRGGFRIAPLLLSNRCRHIDSVYAPAAIPQECGGARGLGRPLALRRSRAGLWCSRAQRFPGPANDLCDLWALWRGSRRAEWWSCLRKSFALALLQPRAGTKAADCARGGESSASRGRPHWHRLRRR